MSALLSMAFVLVSELDKFVNFVVFADSFSQFRALSCGGPCKSSLFYLALLYGGPRERL